MTDVIIHTLRQRSQNVISPIDTSQATDSISRHATLSSALIDFEYQWGRFGIGEFLRLHLKIDIDQSEEMQALYREMDSVQQRFLDELEGIVNAAREQLEEHAKKTQSILDEYHRGSVVTLAGLSLRILGEENKCRVIQELLKLLTDPREPAIAKERILDVIPRIEHNPDAFVGSLLQLGIMAHYQDNPRLRANAFATLGKLSGLSESGRSAALFGLKRFGLEDESSEVTQAAHCACAALASENTLDG